jgi:hypothetical protein
MPVLDDIKKALEGHQKAEDILKLVEAHAGEVAKTEGEKAAIEAKRKANSEAKNIRERFKKTWEDFEIDPDADDFEDKITALKDALKKAKDGGGRNEGELKTLMARIEKAEKKAADAEAREKEAKARARRKDAESAIITALTEKKAIKPQILLNSIMPNIKIAESEDAAHIYKVGDDEFSIQDGIAKFLEANPEFIANATRPGGDSGHLKGGDGSPKKQSDINKRREEIRAKMNNRLV